MRRFGPLFTLAAPLLLSATPTELPSGAVWTVGPDGDYLEIQRAVDLASSGDIIVVAPGDYQGVDIAGKSLAIIGLPTRSDDVGTWQLRIRDLAADQSVLVSGLSSRGPDVLPYDDSAGARILNNDGTVVLQDCVFTSDNHFGNALSVEASAVVFVSSSKMLDTTDVQDSSVALFRSTCRGTPSSDAFAGLWAEGSFLFLSGCDIRGGDSTGGSCCGNGGDGMVLSACEAYGIDTTVAGGAEGMYCELVCKWGLPGHDILGSLFYTELEGIHRALDIPAAVHLNPNGTAPVTFTFHGDLDERAYLFWGSAPSFEWMPTHNGVFAFDGPMADTFGALDGPGQRGPGPIRLSSHLMGPLSTTLSRTFLARIVPREGTEGEIGLYQAMMKVNGEPLRYLTEPRFVLVYE